jgi:hypothetical protein
MLEGDSKSVEGNFMGVTTPPPGTNLISFFTVSYRGSPPALIADSLRHQGHFRYRFGYSTYLAYFE